MGLKADSIILVSVSLHTSRLLSNCSKKALYMSAPSHLIHSQQLQCMIQGLFPRVMLRLK